MRGREMHPLCCIAIDCAHWVGGGGGDQSPPPSQQPDRRCRDRDRDPNAAGVLCKWTNFGKGWRPRWFELRDGVLSYSKDGGVRGGDVRLIGDLDTARLWLSGSCRKRRKSGGRVVHLKVLSFRESRSDKKRFYIFSSTKTLHLKADSKKDRAAWIDALVSTRCAFSLRALDDHTALIQGDVSFPTNELRHRLLEEGVNDALIKDCEQIMLSEFSQLKLLYEEQFSLLALGQVEEGNLDSETVGVEGALLLQDGFSSSWHGKYSEYSTTESSEDVERQELDELSAEDEPCYFDTRESFSGSVVENSSLPRNLNNIDDCENDNNCTCNLERLQFEAELPHREFPQIERRKRLPDPVEKEKGVSLWSIIKDNVGKDLTRVCLPVYFNEPLSSLQKCFEELEYSYLLDRAYEYGRTGNDLMRILNVAAFAVSAYASSEGRPCKPFNPLLGETYEADFPEKGVRFLSEKVSHHPMLIACHCEGRGWKFWGDSNLRSKFWGRSIQLDPVGILTLEFDDGEIFQWSKVTTSIYNLIFGKIYCDHHGTMHIQGNHQYSCRLKFKEQSILDRKPHQVQGFVENATGTKVANLMGKWDDSMYYVKGDDFPGTRGSNSYQNGSLLWKRNEPPADPTRYNLSSFAITLNELTSDLLEKLPPTDSRRRPDQRHLENGEYEKANVEKQRLEKRQRLSRKLQESGWKPRWFHRDSEEGTFRYVGGYWEGRERKQWDGCLDIFGEFSENNTDTS